MRATVTCGEPANQGEADGRWSRRFWGVLASVFVVRVIYAALFPLDLAPDESYYWDWGRRPDYGYFSKPPMIGWLMGLAGWLGGNSEFGIKVFPVCLASGGLVFVYRLGRDMFGAAAGFWGAMIMLATPANAALNSFFTIDAPLFLFWSASLWLAWRVWTAGGQGIGWSLALAASLGLGYLTKQIQCVFPVLLLVFVFLERRGGERRLPGATLAAVIVVSVLFLVPPLVWNWQHDWITFRHTADELETSPFRWRRSAKFVLEFVGGQAALGGGLSWILMVVSAVWALSRWRGLRARERFLLVFSVPGVLAYAALAVHQRVEQNWPMVFYPAAAVLLAGIGWGTEERRNWRVAVGRGVALGGGLAVLLMAVPFVFPETRWAGTKGDPTARVRGWRPLADEVGKLRAALPRPEQTFLLAPRDRYVASALAFYLPDHPTTFCWEDARRPESQYGIWGAPEGREGWDALVIEQHPESSRIQELARSFRTWEPHGELRIPLGPGDGRSRRYFVFWGREFRQVDEGAWGRISTGDRGIQLKSK